MRDSRSFSDRLGRFINTRPWLSMFGVLLLLAALAPGLANVRINNDYRVYFSPENEDLIAWENLLDTYSRSDGLIVVVEAKDGARIFSPQVMPVMLELVDRLWKVPYVSRVDAITNFQYVHSVGNDVIVENLVPADAAASAELLKERERVAYAEPYLKDQMLSKDGTVSGMYLQLMIPKEGDGIAHAAQYMRDLKRDIESKYPQVRLRTGGIVMLNAAFDEYTRNDLALLIPIMLVVVVVVAMLIFRSLKLSLAILTTMFLSVVATMGIAGHLGIELSPHSAIAPEVMLAISIATAIHVVATFVRHMHLHQDKQAAINATLKQNLLPVSLTSLTTSIGFFSMLLSEIPPLRHLGIMCGLGTLFAFVATVVFLPALLRVTRLRIRKGHRQEDIESHWTTALADFLLDHRALVLLVIVAVLTPIGWGVASIEINDHPTHLFAKRTQFRQDADFVDANLAGTTTVQFSLPSGQPGGISDPAYMRKLEAFKSYLMADPLVNHVTVLSDTIKRINRSMHGDDPAYYRLPDDKATTAQYLLFYEMNLPFGQSLNTEINVDKSAVRLVAIINSTGSRAIIEFLDRTHDWLTQNLAMPETRGVSVLVMFSYMAKRLASNMFLTALVAVAMIGLVLVITLRSVKLGLLSLIPNLLPILTVFGLWSLSGNTLDFAATLIFSMTLGVVVDDTIHIMNKYLQAVRHEGESAGRAVRVAMQSVGPAILYSTIILVCGFLPLTASAFGTNITLGLLTALTFIVALALDLLLLPVLLSFATIRQREPKPAFARDYALKSEA